jgi:hypothetical protein
MATPIPVIFTISTACLTELTAACQNAVPGTAPNTKNVSVSRPCAEETWNALMIGLKGPAPASKKKGGKTSTSVRQKSGRPTGSSPRSGKGS